MKLRGFMKHIAVFVAWAINSSLAVWVMMVVRNALLTALAVWYVGDSNPRAWRARFWDRAYFVFAGLGLLIFIFAIEGYLQDGRKTNDIFRRFARAVGIQLLVLFPADLLTSLLQQSLLGRYSVAVMVVELLLGVGLLVYAIKMAPQRTRRVPSQGEQDAS
jgi:hypothetical protein